MKVGHGKKTDQKMKPYLVYEYLMQNSDASHFCNERLPLRRNDGSYTPTRYASTLCLMLCATHLVALHATLVEQSSSARLQASLQTRSASIILRR